MEWLRCVVYLLGIAGEVNNVSCRRNVKSYVVIDLLIYDYWEGGKEGKRSRQSEYHERIKTK